MSYTKQAAFRPASGARRARESGSGSGHSGKGRWSEKRMLNMGLGLLRGAAPEFLSRRQGAMAATLSEWREALVAVSKEGIKIRQAALIDEQGWIPT